MIEKLKRVYRYYFKNPPKSKIDYKTRQERHGTVYGGWNILPNSLNANSIVYSIGIGQDISFDLSVIKKYGCKVFGYDPTPRVAVWLADQNTPKDFIFNPIGLSDSDGTLTFHTPENEAHISHTIVAKENTQAVEVKCSTLATMLNSNGHQSIDLLKMDIEGFEYGVLENMVKHNIYPKQLLVEFHHFFPEIGNAKTEEAIAYLQQNGYKLFSVADSFCEYSFVYQN